MKKGKMPGLAIMLMAKKKEKSQGKYGEMAQELLDAIKSDDAKAFGSALKDFIKVCMMEDDKEEMMDEDEE